MESKISSPAKYAVGVRKAAIILLIVLGLVAMMYQMSWPCVLIVTLLLMLKS